jgi:hypothetical protein
MLPLIFHFLAHNPLQHYSAKLGHWEETSHKQRRSDGTELRIGGTVRCPGELMSDGTELRIGGTVHYFADFF